MADISNQNSNMDIATSLRVVMGQRFFIPVMGQSAFVENGRDNDRINNYAFILLFVFMFRTYICIL